MSDILTQQERAAIAAYTGPITVCPPRTFTPQEQLGSWRDQRDRMARAEIARQNQRKKVAAEAAERTAAAIELRRAGLRNGEIAERLGVTEGSVLNYFHNARCNGVDVPEPNLRQSSSDAVAELFKSGVPTSEIAKRLKLTRNTVAKYVRDSGLRDPLINSKLTQNEIAQMLQWHTEGCSGQEIARRLGKAPTSICRRLRKLGEK